MAQLFLGYAVMFSELILAPVTPSNSARGAGIILSPSSVTCHRYTITTKRRRLRAALARTSWMGIVADCVTSAIFLTTGNGAKLAVNWTDEEKRISRHAELGRLVPRDVAAQYFAGAAGSLAGLCAVPAGTEVWRSVPRWAETELQAMGPLCSREKRMLGLMVGALVLWIFGGDYIDAAMVGYSVVALMLLLRIISWDDIVSNQAAWNVFFWLASLITLATGLNNAGLLAGLANC